MKDIDFMFSFFNDMQAQSESNSFINKVEEIETLVNKYKLQNVSPDQKISAVSFEMGKLGSFIINRGKLEESITLKYKEGEYDYISLLQESSTAYLFTDYSNEQPYNRQGGLYCNGWSWANLELVEETEEYRYFTGNSNYSVNSSFAIWGFSYNNYWNTLKFGIIIPIEAEPEFIIELLKIITRVY